MLLVKNGLISDAVHDAPYAADIAVEGGKIAAIGENLPSDGGEVIDASGLFVYPGFVDAHCHLGLEGGGIGFEGNDVNEMTDILTPQLRAIDAFNPLDESIAEARHGGVTTVCTGPGSANVLGGVFATIKTFGRRVDDMVIDPAAAMKCAFGENPKRCYKDKSNFSRMSTAAKLREMLFKTREYMAKLDAAGDDMSKRPAFDMKLQALIPVLRGELPLKAHAHRADDIFTAIRIAKEFGVRLTLEHVTEGQLIVEDLAKENYPLAVGPSMTHKTKYELRDKTFETPGIMSRAGCSVSIITDSPVIEEKYLTLCAALAMKNGMDEASAFRAITINPARHIGADKRIGSLEPGKDADIVVMTAPWYEVAAEAKHVVINGVITD